MSIRTALASFAGLVLFMSFTPAFALAQTNCQNGANNWFNWNNTTTSCQNGTLLVYVQVSNDTYNNYTAQNRAPGDFAVTVVGTNANPSSFFPGSLQGTSVTVQGSYTVQALPQAGYSATYSQGCSGTVANGQSSTCIITESNAGAYTTYPNTYYPNQYYPTSYPYNTGYNSPLYCSPANQTVTVGTNVTFTAQGGEFSQFNWSNSTMPNAVSYNSGRSYTATLTSPGVNTISVMNGSQTATCSVNVVGYPVVGYGNPGTIAPIGTTYPGGVTVTPTYIPALPNTGFAPQDGIAYAFAAVLLMASTFMSYPYVRKALAIVAR